MTETLFVAVILLIAGLLAFWLRDRTRVARRLQSLCDRDRELEAVLNGFMEESERITVQLSRLIAVNRLSIAVSKETENPSADRSEAESSRPKTNGLERRHLVVGLAQRGRSIPEIAERLMIPGGEVELILNLAQSRRTAASPSA